MSARLAVRLLKRAGCPCLLRQPGSAAFTTSVLCVRPTTFLRATLSVSAPTRLYNAEAADQDTGKVLTKEESLTDVFVQGLPDSWLPGDARVFFQKFGKVKRVFVPKLRRYAICTYYKPSAAKNAIEALDGAMLKERLLRAEPCKTSGSESQPAGNSFEVSSLFIRNLPTGVTKEEILDLFLKFKPVDATVLERERGCSAIVTFKTPEVTSEALLETEGISFKGARIEVSFKRTTDWNWPVSLAKQDFTDRSLFVARFGEAGASQLRDHFQQFGEVVAVRVLKSGGAFVQFSSDDAQKAALQRRNDTPMDGKKLRIEEPRRHLGQAADIEYNELRIRVGNIRRGTSVQEVNERFKKFGPIAQTHIPQRGDAAYIQFENTKDAAEAVATMNGQQFEGQAVVVAYAKLTSPRSASRSLQADTGRYRELRRTHTDSNVPV